MKKLILLVSALGIMAACNDKKKEEAAKLEQQAMLDSIATANRQQHMMDSLNMLSNSAAAPVNGTDPDVGVNTDVNTPTPHHSPKHHPTAPSPTPEKQDKTVTKDEPKAVPTEKPDATPAPETKKEPEVAATPTTEAKKKGINNAAKGAIIGLGTGAAAGAVLGKNNRVQGAVIGGIIGAGAGAVGGAVMDKNKKKKAAARDSAYADSVRKARNR